MTVSQGDTMRDTTAEVVNGKAQAANVTKGNDKNRGFFKVPHLVWWILCIGGMACTHIIGHAEEPVRHLLPLEIVALKIFGSRDNLKIVFNLACLAHILEAQYAVYICAFQLKLTDTWPLWALQTALLGYPSLSLLIERRTELIRIYAANEAAKQHAQKNKQETEK